MASRILHGLCLKTQMNSFLKKGAGCKMARSFSSTRILSVPFLKYEVKNDVAVVTFDTPNSKVNVLSTDIIGEFEAVLDKIKSDPAVKAAVINSSKPECFIAGADINMLQSCKSFDDAYNISKEGQRVFQAMEECPKPVVSAIMGSCLGGGLEVALSTHYRVAAKDKKTVLGVPEVMLGVLPGAGGTQRLPKLVSVTNALDMALTGKNIRPDKAKKMGLVDHVVDTLGPGIKSGPERTREYLEEVAIECARGLANGTLTKTPRKKNMQDKVMDKLLQYEFGRNFVFNKAKQQVMKMTQGLYPAPLKIIEAIRTGVENPKEGWESEAKGFGMLAMTNESKALMGLFQGQTATKRNPYGAPQKKSQNLGVLGAGLMGAGIVQVSIDKGIHTVMKDADQPGLVRGQQQIEKGLKDAVKKRKLTQFDADIIYSRVDPTVTYEGFDKLDYIIEAVPETLSLKHKVIQQVEQHISEDCIFASNTSAIPITDVAKGSKRPEKMIGMHYFSPVDKMLLLEIITTDKTDKETLSRSVDLGLRQGKCVIVVKDGPGFYTTRALASYMSEVFVVLLEGKSPKELDSFTRKIGFPVGSTTLLDEVGFDVGYHVGNFAVENFGERFGFPQQGLALLQQMMDKGFLGRKNGKGLYIYSGQKNKEVNEEAIKLLEQGRIESKLPLTDENIKMRLLSRFVNEAVLILQEGILANPVDGDIGAVFGLGFPPNLGGPFRFVDIYGADKLVDKMHELEAAYGLPYTPCQLLLDHAKDPTKKFHSQ